MANYTAVAAGGAWNVTTTWSPAGIPGAADTAILNSSSGNVTVPAAGATCVTLTLTGYTGTLLLSGNLTIVTSGLNLGSFTGTINFNAGDIIMPDGLFNLGNASVYTTLGTGGVLITKPSASFSIFNTNNKIWNCKFALGATGTTSPTIYFEDNPVEVTGLVSFQATTTGTYNLISGDIFTPNLIFLKISGNFTLSGSTIYTTSTSGQNLGITGSGSQTLTGSGTHQLRSPLRIAKTGGTLSLSGTINYNTGTLTYVSGTVSAGSSTLAIATNTTLDTGGMTWANVSISTGNVTSTITLTSALNTSGQLYLSSGTLTFGGAGSLNPSGSLYVQFSNSASGAVFTLNLKNNITVTNCTFQTSTSQPNNGINVVSNSITITGNLSLLGYGYVYGTTTLNLTGTGSWTHQFNTTTLRNNLNINTSGTLTISGSIYYDTGTITHLGGTVSASSSTLWISSTAIGLNTSGMTWGTIVGYYASVTPTATITLGSQLNCSAFYANYNTGSDSTTSIVFSGAFGLNVTSTLYIGITRRNSAGGVPASGQTALTLSAPSTCANLQFYLGGASFYGAYPVTVNGSTLTVNNSINTYSNIEYNQTISGTTEIIMKGTTWTFSTTNVWPSTVTIFATNVTLQPTTTLTINTSSYTGTLFYYSSRTLKYVSGTVSTTLGLVATGATLNLGAFANWNDRDIYLSGTTTLQSDLNPNNLFTYSTAVALSGAFNINVKGNLSIGIATSGASTPIFLNGTGNQTYSHSSAVYLSNNLTINKASGTLTLGANIYYNTGTFTYITATSVNTSTNSTTLNIGGSCTLATNGISWVNLTISVTATIALTNDLVWSNNWTSTTGTIAFSGVGNLAPLTTANLLFTGTPTITLKNNIQVFNVTLNGSVVNTNTISLSENLSVLGSCSGTTSYIINGTGSQSWSSPAVVYLQSPLTINKPSGVLTLGAIVGMIANLTYIAGEVDAVTNSNTFYARGGTFNVGGMTFNNFIFSTNGGDVITLASDLYAGGTFTAGGAGTINGSFNVYSGRLNINNSTSGAISTTVTYNGGSFYCSGDCTFSGGGSGGQVITTNTVYVGGSMLFNATGTNQGPTNLIMTGNGVVSQSLSSNPIYSNIFINTGGKIVFSNTLYFTSSRNVTISLQRGNVDATKCTLFLPLATGTYNLINNNKINWKTVYLPSGGNVSMNEFFNGSAQVKTNVLPTSTTNYTIAFTDNFEKISKFVKLTNCTLSKRNQLLMLTNIPDKKSNIGVRFFNNLPNGVAENKPSISVQPMLSPALVGDPAMLPR